MKPGDTLLIMLPNCAAFIELWWASAKVGIVEVPVNTGEFIPARRAEAEKLARRIASRAPLAVQLHKTMLDCGLEAALDAMLKFETEALVVTAMSDDHREGVAAFFDKREPRFKGY